MYARKYGLKISYSWGDEEPIIEYKTKDMAWRKAKKLAMNEAELVSEEQQSEVGLSFNKEEGRIILHYNYCDDFCFYDIIEL